jgi:hypothetical protein
MCEEHFKIGDKFIHTSQEGKTLIGRIVDIISYPETSSRCSHKTYQYEILGGNDYPEFEIGSPFEMECVKVNNNKRG